MFQILLALCNILLSLRVDTLENLSGPNWNLLIASCEYVLVDNDEVCS